MGKAGKALKQVLNNHGLSQNQLAVMLKIERGNVYRWVHEIRDPTAETLAEIAEGLYHINPAAADEFVRLYLGDFIQKEQVPDSELSSVRSGVKIASNRTVTGDNS